ncbi:MAG: EVE domain-containing protein [Saprospiraceae bacterium]|nr:EVE domain-containing protein [Saprospiraceae bacterium]
MEQPTDQKYWIVKSEPDVFSYEQLVKDGTARWDGVRNYQARNNLRAMQLGDLCLFYHSNIGLEVVGIARVQRTHYPDPTAEKGDWSCVDLEPYKAFNRPVQLPEIKNHADLQNIALVRNGRLSVMPLTFDEFSTLLRMGATQL